MIKPDAITASPESIAEAGFRLLDHATEQLGHAVRPLKIQKQVRGSEKR